MPRYRPFLTIVAALTAAALLLSSCSDDSTTAGSAEADVAAATEALAAYTGQPTVFPVEEPLKRTFPVGAKFAYLQCGAPSCALLSGILTEAANALGVELVVVKAGSSVNEQQSAAESVIALDPIAVLVNGIEPSAIGKQLKELTSSGVVVGTMATTGTEEFGVQAPITGDEPVKIFSNLLAEYVLAHRGGKANVVFYNIPEAPFSRIGLAAFKARMDELCPDCKVRTTDIPITSIGTKAPSDIVSDLQRNPQTNVAVFPTLAAATGLPAALKTAGIDVDVVGAAPLPGNLQDLKDGGITAAIGLDLGVMAWMTVDAVARVASGQPLTAAEEIGLPPIQVLEQKDVTFDPANGFSAFPDYADLFAQVWSTQ